MMARVIRSIGGYPPTTRSPFLEYNAMNYDDFVGRERPRYEVFSQAVASIVQAAIAESPEKIRLQQITSRAKSATSLHRKLTERDLLKSDSIETELKDLAGCRLIFYTNSDINLFLNSRLIFENFAVDFDGSQIHHSVGKDRTADQLYFAIHYLVSLKPDRLGLPEFRKFAGMRCEVQIQTILNHAWAETSHDILYHRPSIRGFGTKQFEGIEKRLRRIMNEYLLPAGYEFQKVQHDFDRLMEGNELFDRGAIEQVEVAKDNNERHEALQHLHKLLPYYDDVGGIPPEMLRVSVDAIKKARETTERSIETPFGEFNGYSFDQVLDEAIEIVESIRYVDIHATFRALCDLYETAPSESEKARILKAVDRLAHNELSIWRQVGFGVQKVLQDEIRSLDDEGGVLRPVVLAVCEHCLDPEITGTTWQTNSVSLQRGAAQPSESYGGFRNTTIDFLFELYSKCHEETDKREVIRALRKATKLPDVRNDSGLTGLIVDDTRRIAEFFLGRVGGEPYEILRGLERHFQFLYRRSQGVAALPANAAIGETVQREITALLAFRDAINKDAKYVLFKTLVGFDSVFPPDWDRESEEIDGPRAYRAARVAEYVKQVRDDNADEWYEDISRCASVKSDDGATFISLTEFLKQLSEKRPAIVLSYPERDEQMLAGFLPIILDGLARSEQKPAVLVLMNEWADKGKHLVQIARFCRIFPKPDTELVQKVSRKAIETRDGIASIESIAAVIEKGAIDLADKVFVPSLSALTAERDARWVNATWYMPKLGEFLRALTEDQMSLVLENMLYRLRLDNHDEWILVPLARTNPKLVWRFFKMRLDRKKNESTEAHYEAIPFELHDLAGPLARDASLAVEAIREWYSPDNNLFVYEGGRLLHAVYPSFGENIEKELLGIVQNGSEKDIDFVLDIFRAYRGEVFLHPLCKELVHRIPEGDDRLDAVELILDGTDVVSGEFGFVGEFQNKKDELANWLDDPRPSVGAFAEKYSRSLARRIASEQRNAEERFELRRRDWERDGEADSPGK
jgi:ppGpp synthetase/RelA/SpoT-type nucleotidyltranferase